VALGEFEQRLEPASVAGGAAREEVTGASAGADLQPAVAPGAGGQLYQPGAVLVQHPELQRSVWLGS